MARGKSDKKCVRLSPNISVKFKIRAAFGQTLGTSSRRNGPLGAMPAICVKIIGPGVGSHWSFEASSFGDCEGGPPRTGQFLIAIDAEAFGGAAFRERLEVMLSAVRQTPQVRLPGERRLGERARQGDRIEVSKAAVELLERYGREGSPAAKP